MFELALIDFARESRMLFSCLEVSRIFFPSQESVVKVIRLSDITCKYRSECLINSIFQRGSRISYFASSRWHFGQLRFYLRHSIFAGTEKGECRISPRDYKVGRNYINL